MKKLWIIPIVLCTACSDDDNGLTTPDPTPAVPLSIVIRPEVAGENFSYSNTYDLGNTRVKFSRVAFYLDSLAVVDLNGLQINQRTAPLQYLFDGDQPQTFQTDITSSTPIYTLKMALGLNRDVNGADPTLAVFPLDQPDMHWGWNPMAGYKFAVLEGQYDSNLDGVVTSEDFYFVYHCATNALYRQIEIGLNNYQGGVLQLDFDLAKAFMEVDIPAVNSEHGAGSTNTQIIGNFENAFAPKI